MKWIFLLSGVIFLSGCGLRQKQLELNKKMAELNMKEHELALKEQSLAIKEQELNDQKKSIDSTSNVVADSLYREHQKIPGIWLVDMQCTETNCPGSAVGDIKSEQWDFKFQHNIVIVAAMNRNQLLRIYTGTYQGDLLKLEVQQDSTESNAKIVVTLQQTSEKEMEGEREIIQASGCHILYSLKLKKQ
jgi:hypothetical protein